MHYSTYLVAFLASLLPVFASPTPIDSTNLAKRNPASQASTANGLVARADEKEITHSTKGNEKETEVNGRIMLEIASY